MAREKMYGGSDDRSPPSKDDPTDPDAAGSGLAHPNAAAESHDGEADSSLRPRRIEEMVGQIDVITRLRIAIDAARMRSEPLGHILLDGPPGLGKSTFATVIPREMNVPVQYANGAGLKAPKELLPYLTNIAARSVLFIDEIHRLPRPVEEYLYTAMEDFRIDIVLGEGVSARTLSMKLQPFTLIGATTRAGMLSGPLRDRFPIREHLTFYSDEELKRIVLRSAGKLGLPIDEDAADLLSSRSRGTPRIANNRLLWVRDYATSRGQGRATKGTTDAAMAMIGIDTLGLDAQDRRYLDTLIRVFGGGPAGVEAIAATMNISTDTLSDEVEPFLLRSELIIRTPRGRMATNKSWQHMPTSKDGAKKNNSPPPPMLFQ
jgi:holliday junction DNA helicase RuvB